MRASKLASKVHRWLALIVGIQVVLWFASGCFMSFFPIEKVRGEHLVKKQEPAGFELRELSVPLSRTLSGIPGRAVAIEVRRLQDRPVLLVRADEANSALYDLSTGRLLSPIDAGLAVALARAAYTGKGRPVGAKLVTAETTQYRGSLPAWRVGFDDDEHSALYVSADEGQVTAVRTDLWRTYDFLWGLHIMDWKNHENLNGWWLWIASALALVIAISGAVLIPSRFGWGRERRRRIAPQG